MTRTNPVHLVLLAAFGAIFAWLAELALSATGRPIIVPPTTIAVVLVLLALVVAVMAWPVRKVARRVEGARVDPFYATRVVVLAKASSISGALLAGAGVGALAYLLTRPVPAVGSVGMTIAMTASAALLMIGGLLAEHWCTIPPDDDDGTPDLQGTPT